MEEVKKKIDLKEKITETIDKTKSSIVKATNEVKTKIVNELDEDGDGVVGVEDMIIKALRIPGIGIDRKHFLTKELEKRVKADVLANAIETTPIQAGIELTMLDKIANDVIEHERWGVSGISTALSTPGGVVGVATTVADIGQYYAYLLKVAQKLMYLYGFPQIDVKEKGQKFESSTMNTLILCLGVMYGVHGANVALKELAKLLGKGLAKKILVMPITKKAFYKILKKILTFFTVNLTKKALAGAVSKAIPIIGGVIGGALTFVTFKPCCDKLKESLRNTMLANPNLANEEIDLEKYANDDENDSVENIEQPTDTDAEPNIQAQENESI